MNLIKFKSIQIFSNGSLNFCCNKFSEVKLFFFYEQDHNNFFLYEKKSNNKKKSNYSTYKNKYL
jgi:hypothetical protein